MCIFFGESAPCHSLGSSPSGGGAEERVVKIQQQKNDVWCEHTHLSQRVASSFSPLATQNGTHTFLDNHVKLRFSISQQQHRENRIARMQLETGRNLSVPTGSRYYYKVYAMNCKTLEWFAECKLSWRLA